MAFTGSISPHSNQTTNDLRQWGQGISQGLVTAGLTNTNASGSINWSTVTAVSGNAASYGYEVFAFNDSLQATHPVFIKLEYRNRATAAPTAQVPSILLTIGTAHNNSGSVTGQLATSSSLTYQFTGGSSNTSPIYNSLFAAGDGWVNMALWYDIGGAGTTSWLLNVERTRDANGNITGQGFCWNVVGTENGATPRSGYVPYSGTVPLSQARIGAFPSPAGILSFTNGNIMPGRIFHFNGGMLPLPITSLMFMPAPFFMSNRPFAYSPYANINAQYMKFGSNGILNTDNALLGRLVVRIS